MYILKSFLKIDNLVLNQVNNNSAIGELSDLAYTYSKDKGYYTNSGTYPGLELVTFTSLSDDTGTSLKVEMIPRVKEFMFKLATWMTEDAAIMPQWFNVSTDVFLSELTDAVADGTGPFTPDNVNPLPGPVGTYEDVVIQACSEEYSVVEPNGNDRYFIHWVQLEIDYPYDTGSGIEVRTAQVKLWLNDEAFRAMYDDFELVIVPMFDDLDDFFDTASNVNALVNIGKEPSNVVQRFTDAKGSFPSTLDKLLTYNWHDPTLPENVIPVPWGVVIYGAAGNDPDAIRESLRTFILENSSHDEPEWGTIFPGIFRTSEFILIPMWHRYATVNKSNWEGVHSPVTSLHRDKELLLEMCPNYTESFILENAESFMFQYKSIAIWSIPSEFNEVGLLKIQTAVPDFASITTHSLDWNRLNGQARDWLERMSYVILKAEDDSEIASLPSYMSRVYRNNIMYIATEINEKTFLVASKKYFKDNLLPILGSEE